MAGCSDALVQHGQPRTLAYPSHGLRKDVKLLELDEELLQVLLSGCAAFKGGPGEEAVLCTHDKTYAVKSVETTNLVLLMQPGGDKGVAAGRGPLSPLDRNMAQHDAGAGEQDAQSTPPGMLVGLATQHQRNVAAAAAPRLVATARVGAHLELVPCAPRLGTLDALLAERPYGIEGEEATAGSSSAALTIAMVADGTATAAAASAQGCGGSTRRGLYTWEDLLARVQASESELRVALAARHALRLDGAWRLVDPGYLGTLLELVMLTAVEHGWSLNQLPGSASAEALAQHGYDPRVTLHCLSVYGTPVSDNSSSDSNAGPGSTAGAEGAAVVDAAAAGAAHLGYYRLDESAVCRHFGKQLLAEQPEWEVGAFLKAWRARVPEGMSPDLALLSGEALVSAGGSSLRHFPLAGLPSEAGARFAALFTAQPHWEWTELEPYVQGLQQPGQTAEALLLKYTRATQARPMDPVTYSMR